MAKKNPSDKNKIKKEFDEFAQKIAKLEAMRHELDSLDLKGFESEASVIRAKLKDVNAIHQIRRDLDKLEQAIRTHVVRRVVKSEQTKKLIEKSKGLEHDHNLMKRKIQEMEGLLEKRKKLAVKKQLSTKEVDDVQEIPHLEKQLKELREDFKEHTHASRMKIDSGVGVLVDSRFGDFLNEIKGELTERLKSKELQVDLQLKSDLEKHEELFAKRYKELADEFHKRYEEKIDNELKREVERKFKQKLNDELDKKRKTLIENLLKENALRLSLDKRSLIDSLEKEYIDKERELRRKIYEKEHNSFLRKINVFRLFSKKKQEQMSEELRSKERQLEIEKEKMEKSFVNKLNLFNLLKRRKQEKFEGKKRLEERQLQLQREKLENENKEREAELRKEKQKLEDETQNKIKNMKFELRRQFKDDVKNIQNKEEKIEKKIQLEEKQLQLEKEKLENRNKEREAQLKKEKEKLEMEKENEIRNIKFNLHKQFSSDVKNIQKKEDKKMKSLLEDEEKKLRSKLEKEYQNKLQLEMKLKTAQLEKKKAELEHHIIDQAKKLFVNSA